MPDEDKEGENMNIIMASCVAKITSFLIKFWSRIGGKGQGGTMSITSPQNRQPVDQPWVEIRGTHTDSTNDYWLLIHDGDKYWPQRRIKPLLDGQWRESVNVDTKPHDRDAALALFKTSSFCNKVLEEWKAKCDEAQKWCPITLPITQGQFEQIQGIVLYVKGSKPI